MCSDTTMKPCICFSVSSICFTSWAAATEGCKRESARSAENNTAGNPQRLAAAYPLRISDMAWVSILTPRCALEFWPRHDGTVRTSVFDPNTYANTKPGTSNRGGINPPSHLGGSDFTRLFRFFNLRHALSMSQIGLRDRQSDRSTEVRA